MQAPGSGEFDRSESTLHDSEGARYGDSLEKVQSNSEWSEWEHDPKWQREWRARQLDNGEWEYDFRYGCDSTDRATNPSYLESRGYYQSDSFTEHDHQISPIAVQPHNPTQSFCYAPTEPQLSISPLNPPAGQANVLLDDRFFDFESLQPEPSLSHWQQKTAFDSLRFQEPSNSSENESFQYVAPQKEKSFPSVVQPKPRGDPGYSNPLNLKNLVQGQAVSSVPNGSRYTTILNPRGFFKPGRIFRFENGQRFVVLQEGQDAAVCAPLQTHIEDRSSVFAQTYTKDRPSVFATDSASRIIQFPVFVEGNSDGINHKSHLDLSNTLSIGHNEKIQNVGRIDRGYLRELKSAFLKTVATKSLDLGSQPPGLQGDNMEEHGLMLTENNYETLRVGSMANESKVDAPRTTDVSAELERMMSSAEKPLMATKWHSATYTMTGEIPQREPILEHVDRDATRSFINDTGLITADSTLGESSITSIPLYGSFKVHNSRKFTFGKIFKILWTEPRGQGPSLARTELVPTIYGEQFYTSIRRFLIFKPMSGHCLCLPILTYNRRGTGKSGVRSEDHAIIYTKTQSGQDVEELPGEPKLIKKPIRMEPMTPRDQLDLASRLNYSKIYTVEYNVKVCFVGKIHKDSIIQFTRDYNLTHAPLMDDEYDIVDDVLDDAVN